MRETTALGAAIAAGLAFGMWNSFAELRDINRVGGAVFEPAITREESASKIGEWEKAVRMSRGWVGGNDEDSAKSTVPGKANGAPNVSGSRGVSIPKDKAASSLISNIAMASGVGATFQVKTRTLNGEESPKTSLISILGDLDDADEEDLILELRKVEVLRKLNKLRKIKLSYY